MAAKCMDVKYGRSFEVTDKEFKFLKLDFLDCWQGEVIAKATNRTHETNIKTF